MGVQAGQGGGGGGGRVGLQSSPPTHLLLETIGPTNSLKSRGCDKVMIM